MRMATAGLLALPLIILLGGANPAAARVETLRWTHTGSGNVTAFRIHWGTSSGSYPQLVHAGIPTSSNGVYSFNIVVPDAATVYVAVSAHDSSSGLSSAYSNERVRSPEDTGGGGSGDGGGTGGGGSGDGGGTGGGGSGDGGGTGGGGSGDGGGTGGGGSGDGGGTGGEPPLLPPNPSGPGLGPLPGEPDGTDTDGGEDLEEPVDPATPQAEPLGAPGRPQVVAE
jgi:hypothetical protein